MLRSEIAVAGVGMTRFTKHPESGLESLTSDACRAAFEHAGITRNDIQAVFCGTMWGGEGAGQRAATPLGLAGVPVVNVENACASGSTAIREAMAWLLAGWADCVLAVGVERLSHIPGPLQVGKNWVMQSALNLPGWYAMKARSHMEQHGVSNEDLASVSVKSRKFAQDNPYAHFRNPVTVEEVLSSRIVADPLTLLQCCPKVDGAAAAILCTKDFAMSKDLRPAWIRGSALLSGNYVFTDADPFEPVTARAAKGAFEEAGVAPEDLDVVECHDAFSIAELLYTEELGLCAAGEGAHYMTSGASSLGGTGATVNPSGGLLSRGHPLGATGIAQLAEVVWQLRGEAGARQREEARLGLVHTLGATEFDLEANACSVLLLERPDKADLSRV